MIQHHFYSPQLVEFWIFQNEQWLTLSNALDLILEKEKINSGRTFVLNGSANDQQDQSQSCNIWSCFLLSILATQQKSNVPFFFLCCNLFKKTGFIESQLPILLLCVLKIILISLPFAFVYSLLLLFLLCSFRLQQITPYMQYHIYQVLNKPKMHNNIHPGPRICGPDPWYNSGGPANLGAWKSFLSPESYLIVKIIGWFCGHTITYL